MMKAVEAAAKNGDPIESTVPKTFLQYDRYLWSAAEDFTDKISGGISDPLYQDPNWRKIKVIIQGVHYPTLADKMTLSNGLDWIIEVHFWQNKTTKQVEQVKLKNTKAEGCRGEETATG